VAPTTCDTPTAAPRVPAVYRATARLRAHWLHRPTAAELTTITTLLTLATTALTMGPLR
jgi:hypothetical protein